MSNPAPASPFAPDPFAPRGAFARDVARRAGEAFDRTGETRFGDAAQWLRAAAAAGLGLGAYGMLLGGAVAATTWIILAAFGAFLLLVQIGHEAAHGTVSRHRIVNRAALFISFAIVGVDARLWRDRHNRVHHSHVNLPGTGIDADSVAQFRLAPDKPWHRVFRLQPLYAPLLYLLGHMSLVWVEDMVMLREKRRARDRDFTTPSALGSFAAIKAVHAALFILLPVLVLAPSWSALLLGYLLASGVIALCFVILVVGTHVSDLAEFPLPDAHGRLAHDWATHQLVTSVDWAPTSRLAVLLSGGANAHVAHHLFPGHHHRHLAMLSGIIAETAAEHGLQHRVTSFGGMVRGQWRHLVALSRPQGRQPA